MEGETYSDSHIQRRRYQGTGEACWSRLINRDNGVSFLIVGRSGRDLEDVIMCHFTFSLYPSLFISILRLFVRNSNPRQGGES